MGPGLDGPCNRPIHVKFLGLCGAHYHQHKRRPSEPLLLTREDTRKIRAAGCNFPTCDRPAVSSDNLCNGHAMQRRDGKDLRPLDPNIAKPHGTAHIRDEVGRKHCVRCGEWKDPGRDFYPASNTGDGVTVYCRSCDRWKKLLRKYGITETTYMELLERQGGGCAVCDALPPGDELLHVDHDHACCPGIITCGNCIRGLLCMLCNLAVGYLRDSAEYADRMALYLHKAASEESADLYDQSALIPVGVGT